MTPLQARSQFTQDLRKSLALDLPYTERMSLTGGREASVLVLFGQEKPEEEAQLLFTRRTELVETHKGQIAFPGGMRDPEDLDEVATALRETQEEVGIPKDQIEIVGRLPSLWTVTGFWVTPVVGILTGSVSEMAFVASQNEIAEIFWAPLSVLRDPKTYAHEFREYQGIRYPTHVYQVGPHRIWGATGAMLKNLLDRLQSVQNDD